MDSTPKLLGFLLMLWITASAKADPVPNQSLKNEISSSKNIVGVATQIITNALMNGQADASSNYVFSPIGFATILSILGQGSEGQTRKEIFNVLEQPDNVDEIKKAYKAVLTKYAGNDSAIAPQFKTWFYIYKNNTAEEEFKKILSEDYLVEIKDIVRFDFDFDEPRTGEEEKSEKNYEKIPSNSKDVIQFEELKNTEPDKTGSIDGFETLKNVDSVSSIDQAIADYDSLEKTVKDKVSKFDKHVEDNQYAEIPQTNQDLIKSQALDKKQLKKKLQKENEGPEKVTLPLKKYMEDSMEIMNAQESRHFVTRLSRAQTPLHQPGDVASALSGNSIVGRKERDSEEAPSQLESKMLLFNGLFYQGNWLWPFKTLQSEDKKYFNSLNGKQDVKYMEARGTYKYAGNFKNLAAIEIPYKNERYSLLIVMPNSESDLRQYSKNSNYKFLNEILETLEPSEMIIQLPKFRFECTSRAEKALGKLGITTLFTSKADLSGVTKNAINYQIQELVQHVAMRVDEGGSTENSLSAGNIESRNNVKLEELSIDKPFMFYVRDVESDVILVSGKVVEIPVELEIPLKFN